MWPKITKDVAKLKVPERIELFSYLVRTYPREFKLAPMGKSERQFYDARLKR